MNIGRSVAIACMALSVAGTASAVPLLCRDSNAERRHAASEWAECFDSGQGRFMSFRPVSNGAGLRITGIDSGAFGALSSHPGAASFSSPLGLSFNSPPSSKWGGANISSNTNAWNGVGAGSNSGNVPGWRDPLPPLGTGHVVDLPKHVEGPPHSQPIGLPPARNVPEPGTLALFGIAMLGAACARRRKVI